MDVTAVGGRSERASKQFSRYLQTITGHRWAESPRLVNESLVSVQMSAASAVSLQKWWPSATPKLCRTGWTLSCRYSTCALLVTDDTVTARRNEIVSSDGNSAAAFTAATEARHLLKSRERQNGKCVGMLASCRQLAPFRILRI